MSIHRAHELLGVVGRAKVLAYFEHGEREVVTFSDGLSCQRYFMVYLFEHGRFTGYDRLASAEQALAKHMAVCGAIQRIDKAEGLVNDP